MWNQLIDEYGLRVRKNMKKERNELKIFYFIGVAILLLAAALGPLGLGDFILPEWGGGVVHQDPQMSENIWLPIPTENVGELWYSHYKSGEIFGCQGNGIVGNGRIAASSFNSPWDNLIIYDFYGNQIWSSGLWLGPFASTSSPMVDINDRVVACDRTKIILVNASDHNNPYVEWNSTITGGIPISPVIVENKTIILPTNNGPFLAYDVETGEKIAEIKLGNHTTIDPYFGIPEMNWTNYESVKQNYWLNSICPYRYNSTSELIEWNSSIPYGIMPIRRNHFFDGNPLGGNPIIHYCAEGNNVTATKFDGLRNWTVIASNNIESGGIYTGEGYFSTINSACVEGNRLYLVTEYIKSGTWPFIDDMVNNTIGRLYAVDVYPDALVESDRLIEVWNYSYFGRSQASATLIDDTLYFDGYNNTLLRENRDPHIYAVYTNGTEKWKVSYPNITWFTFTTDPRGGFWYEDCDQVLRPNTGGNKLVRFYEENGSIWEELDMKTLLNDTGENKDLPVIPSSDMTICGTPTNPIMLISANHEHFKEGKWVLAINLSDNNTVIWKIPIESIFNRNYAHGDYTILTKNNVSRIVFPTNVGGVMGVGTFPDCWFENLSYECWDKPDDGDSYNDSVNVSFMIKSCLPHDMAMVKVALISQKNPILQRKIETKEYNVNTSGTEGKITVTLPCRFLDGEYKLGVYLYNSSGKFKSEHLNISEILKFDIGIYANETCEFGPFYLSNGEDITILLILFVVLLISLLIILIIRFSGKFNVIKNKFKK